MLKEGAPVQGTQRPFLGGQTFRLLLFLGPLSEACRVAASSWTLLTSLRLFHKPSVAEQLDFTSFAALKGHL